MATRITPSIDTKGIFQLKAPWGAVANMQYTVEAIRSFDDFGKMGIDVFKTYYEPLGLVKRTTSNQAAANAVDWDDEVRSDVHIITLRSMDGRYIYVPDSYVASYPGTDGIPYKHIVVAASLGPLPENYDTAAIQNELSELIRYRFGIVSPDVKVVSAQSISNVTPAQHHALTEARSGSMNTVPSVYSQNVDLQNQVNELTTINTALTNLLRANGLIE